MPGRGSNMLTTGPNSAFSSSASRMLKQELRRLVLPLRLPVRLLPTKLGLRWKKPYGAVVEVDEEARTSARVAGWLKVEKVLRKLPVEEDDAEREGRGEVL